MDHVNYMAQLLETRFNFKIKIVSFLFVLIGSVDNHFIDIAACDK